MSRATVLQYATNHLGIRVYAEDDHNRFGDGVCWDLAYLALKFGGDTTPRVRRVRSGSPRLYRWSSQVIRFDDAQPGDILQFRNYEPASISESLEAKQGTTTIWQLGPVEEIAPGHEIEWHTAILVEKLPRNFVRVIEQNGANGPNTRSDQYFALSGEHTQTFTDFSEIQYYTNGLRRNARLNRSQFRDATSFVWTLQISCAGSLTVYQPETIVATHDRSGGSRRRSAVLRSDEFGMSNNTADSSTEQRPRFFDSDSHPPELLS